jgi:hypothetical protein
MKNAYTYVPEYLPLESCISDAAGSAVYFCSFCQHHNKICKRTNYRTVNMIPIKIISTILVFLLIEISLCQNEMQITVESVYSPGILHLHSLNLRALLTHF